MPDSASSLTELGVAAIRDGVAGGEFSAVEVAEAFNANVAAAHDAARADRCATSAAALLHLAQHEKCDAQDQQEWQCLIYED